MNWNGTSVVLVRLRGLLMLSLLSLSMLALSKLAFSLSRCFFVLTTIARFSLSDFAFSQLTLPI